MTNSPTAGDHGARRDRFVQEYQHDSYKLPGKLTEPTVCPTCSAVFHKGRWSWAAAPVGAHETVCPACHRVKDKYPKGLLTLKGTFAVQQSEQVMGVIKNIEKKENKEHPLARIMSIETTPEGLVVSTTDSHLPRQIGEALKHAHHGELAVHYDKDEDFVRVIWTKS
jgi:NMD protein affecting ribosome stability and mRNA decay